MEVMLDLETLSVNPNAAILTIGAIKWNRRGPLLPMRELPQFYRRIELKSCVEVGREINEGTKKWWSEQSKEAQYEVFGHPDRIPLKQALEEFKEWYGFSTSVWANGDDFDCVILSESARACNVEVPWKFWQTRDVRTLYDLGNVKKRDLPNNGAHNALDDCYNQIIGVKRALKNLNLY